MAEFPSFAIPSDLAAFTNGAIPADDQRSEPALSAASRIVRNYCGWHVWPVIPESVEVIAAGRLLALPSRRVVSVSTVVDSGGTLDPSDYRWNELGEIWRAPARWALWGGPVTVTMEHGFDDVDDVKQLVMTIAARSMVSPLGVVREQTLASSVTWSQTAPGVAGGLTLLAHEKEQLTSYRLVSV